MGKIKKVGKSYIGLAEMEVLVAHLASRIFAAHIMKQEGPIGNNENALISESVRQAIKLAKKVDARIKVDTEF